MSPYTEGCWHQSRAMCLWWWGNFCCSRYLSKLLVMWFWGKQACIYYSIVLCPLNHGCCCCMDFLIQKQVAYGLLMRYWFVISRQHTSVQDDGGPDEIPVIVLAIFSIGFCNIHVSLYVINYMFNIRQKKWLLDELQFFGKISWEEFECSFLTSSFLSLSVIKYST